ncbi:MAG: hypothetical protein IT365_27565 [Candidatus Hydrogenedentes bacterium]|nr:hypothetical protein [Candidatus Hydrogenedentota bacterium]
MARPNRLLQVLLLATLVTACATESTNAPGVSLEIGMLEETMNSRVLGGREAPEKNLQTQVRLVFRHINGEWEAFPWNVRSLEQLAVAHRSFQGDREWFVALDGRRIGHVRSTGTEYYFWYKDVGVQSVVGGLEIDAAIPRTREYAGWMNDPVRRPLVLTRTLQFSILDDWKESTWSTEPPADAVQWFFQHVKMHRADTETPTEVSEEEMRERGDISVVRAFRSSEGEALIALWYETEMEVYYEEGFGSLERPFEHWFIVRPNKVEYLASGITYLDRGDYDGDGRTEFVFFVDRYNENGYCLFWDDFQKSAQFIWHYH